KIAGDTALESILVQRRDPKRAREPMQIEARDMSARIVARHAVAHLDVRHGAGRYARAFEARTVQRHADNPARRCVRKAVLTGEPTRELRRMKRRWYTPDV